MTNNVLQLEPRRRRKASGLFVEFRLLNDFRFEVSLHDSRGRVGAVEYGVTVVSPPDFDLGRLRTQWDRLRDASGDVA